MMVVTLNLLQPQFTSRQGFCLIKIGNFLGQVKREDSGGVNFQEIPYIHAAPGLPVLPWGRCLLVSMVSWWSSRVSDRGLRGT